MAVGATKIGQQGGALPSRDSPALILFLVTRSDLTCYPWSSSSPKPCFLEAPLHQLPHERGSDQKYQKPTDEHGAGHVLTLMQAEERGGYDEGP